MEIKITNKTKKNNKNNKKGISLIVLVITIIVMIILAGAVILSISNTNILDRAQEAVDKTNLSEVQQIASIAWAEAYMDGARTKEEFEEAITEGLKNVDTSDYDITVTASGVDVKTKIKYENETPVPEEWTANVVAVVDTVPIPKGFVASKATGENTKVGGLVIYEGTEEVNDTNVEDARRDRNQYVWIPVAQKEFVTKFRRQYFSGDGGGIINETSLGSNSWEVVLNTETNMPLSEQDATYMSSTTLAEVQAMYASVYKYGGFYIARYEAGMDTQRTSSTDVLVTGSNVHSKMNKIPYGLTPWSSSSTSSVDTGGAVEVARSIYTTDNEKYGVVSTLTYAVQWDTVMQWWMDTGAMTKAEITGRSEHGNYSYNAIASADELNAGAKYATFESSSALSEYKDVTADYTKSSSEGHALTTGALKVANINNIYDMAGNMFEWTMEGSRTNGRLSRGGLLYGGGSDFSAGKRAGNSQNSSEVDFGFRPSLYIK